MNSTRDRKSLRVGLSLYVVNDESFIVRIIFFNCFVMNIKFIILCPFYLFGRLPSPPLQVGDAGMLAFFSHCAGLLATMDKA